MHPHQHDYLHSVCIEGLTQVAQVENAFLALLDTGEDPEQMEPARFATLAHRAALLSATAIDWDAEVIQSRLLPPGYLASLAIKLGSGEIEPLGALAELSEREAEITCRVGGIFLTEVLRRATTFPPEPAPSDG